MTVSYTILTNPEGKQVGTVETRKVTVNGVTLLEKTYVMDTDSTNSTMPIPTPSPSPFRGRVSKWSRADADKISSQHVSRGGQFDSKQLATMYRVSKQTIDNLLTGKTKRFRNG